MGVLDEAVKIYREAIPILLVSLVGGLFAGAVLGGGGMREAIRNVPGLLVMVPAILATRGNVYGALGARISTALHQGLIEPRLGFDKRLTNAVTASFINGFSMSIFIAVATWFIMVWVLGDNASVVQLVGISVIAAVLSAVTLISVLLVLIFTGYKRGMDPDNMTGPIVTTTGDVFGVVFLYTGVVIVQGVL